MVVFIIGANKIIEHLFDIASNSDLLLSKLARHSNTAVQLI